MNEGFFQTDVILDTVIIKDLLENISASYAEESKKERFGGTISGHLNCFPKSAAKNLIKNVKETTLLDDISKYFSVNIYDYNISIGANINLPGSHFQHMHADSNYFDEFFILNIPLIDTNENNGSISIVPESHLRPYSFINYKTQGLYKKRVRINQKVGSCLIRTSNLWHRGTPNKSKEIRPMINLVFTKNKDINDTIFLVSNLDNHPDLIGPIEFANNWYKATRTGYLWELLTVKIPFVHSVKRFFMALIRPEGTST